MAYRAPSQCPVCARQLSVSQMHCQECGTELRGDFKLCRFCTLPEQHLTVIETYLRCRGNMKELEKALGISYPTARAMLDAALDALGFGTEIPAGPQEPAGAIAALERGEIDVTEAINQLKKRRQK